MLSIAWNTEVLWVSGFLARIIYEEEMRVAARAEDELATQLGLYTMARFAFGPTVPHSGVSEILQDAFFSCCHEPKSPLPVVSGAGISDVSNSRFRQNNKDLPPLNGYPVLHEEVGLPQRSDIINRYEIPLFKSDDIVQEFQSGVTQDTMRLFFIWWDDVHRNPPSSSSKHARDAFCQKLAFRGVLHLSDEVEIALKDIKYVTFFSLPDDLSLPDAIYIDVTPGVPTKDSVACFGWTQLSLLYWLEYACFQAPQLASSEDSGEDSDVGYRILRVLVQFALVEDLSPEQWDRAADLMEDRKCIPTNMGLKLPTDSYFDDADGISGNHPVAKETDFLNILPTPVAVDIGFESRSVDPIHVRKVLTRIRVRATVEREDNDLLEVGVCPFSLSKITSMTTQGRGTIQRAWS